MLSTRPISHEAACMIAAILWPEEVVIQPVSETESVVSVKEATK